MQNKKFGIFLKKFKQSLTIFQDEIKLLRLLRLLRGASAFGQWFFCPLGIKRAYYNVKLYDCSTPLFSSLPTLTPDLAPLLAFGKSRRGPHTIEEGPVNLASGGWAQP